MKKKITLMLAVLGVAATLTPVAGAKVGGPPVAAMFVSACHPRALSSSASSSQRRRFGGAFAFR